MYKIFISQAKSGTPSMGGILNILALKVMGFTPDRLTHREQELTRSAKRVILNYPTPVDVPESIDLVLTCPL